MAKLVLNDVTNIGGNPTSAANTINGNNDAIEAALENTLSRDGSTPNQMLTDIDLNGNDLLNVDNLEVNNLTVNGTGLQEQIQIAVDAAEDASQSAIEAQGSASAASASADAALAAEVAAEAAQAVVEAALDDVLYTTDIGTLVQAWNVGLDNISAFGYTLIDDVDNTAARTTLGLGSLATLSSINNDNWSGTDLAIANGGTGASVAATALSNLGGQPLDALLTSIAGLTTAAGGFIRTTGVDTVAAQAIVGTVSQSGGTPTGAIIENVSNANGRYIRFADGTQICTHSITDGTAISTAAGSLFQNAADIVWTFPIAFAAAPNCYGAPIRSAQVVGTAIQGVDTTTMTFRSWSASSIGASSTATRLLAIGRWFNA